MRTPHTPRPYRRRRARTRVLTAGALCVLLTVSGCGLVSGSRMSDTVRPGSVGKGRPLAGADLTVTSKEFTEQIVLGQIMGLLFQAAGANVVDRTSIQGSVGAREAVRTGSADAMYEYTGTSWITYLGHSKPIPDARKQFEAVRKEDAGQGISWLEPSSVNNVYALAVNSEVRRKYGLRTLSDVAKLSRRNPQAVKACVDNEFASRDDGLNGMQQAYGMRIPAANVSKMSGGVVYTQVAQAAPCPVGQVTATDGRIPAMGLHVLKDDRSFFPIYSAAPEINSATLKRYPQLARVLAPVTRALNNREMQALNGKVDVDGEDPHAVAKEWLVQKGFIRD